MAPMEDTVATMEARHDAGPGSPKPRPFEEFFESEHRGLYGALRLLCRDGHEAEELMQDAFLKLLERWDRIRDLEDPTGYLYRTALNLFRSRHRRLRLALRRTMRPRPAPDELAAVEDRAEVMRALAPLTRGQRAAVVLVDGLGLTSEEAAAALGVKPSTVRVQVGRGRAALKEAWGANDG
jgi:RNA polymerase sigma-70 factor (ECF subfamily)